MTILIVVIGFIASLCGVLVLIAGNLGWAITAVVSAIIILAVLLAAITTGPGSNTKGD